MRVGLWVWVWGLLLRKLYPSIKRPEVVAPITIHPAFEKAAHYFDLTMVHVPLDANFRLDMAAMRRAITHNTILLVASAPQYCYGVRPHTARPCVLELSQCMCARMGRYRCVAVGLSVSPLV
jgi:hypothetical protein